MKKILVVFLILFGILKVEAQQSINDYKYVVVPLQFDFLKGQNQYRLNTLTKFLFEQEGFEVYYDNKNLPKDLFNDRCLAMYADVKEAKGAFLYTKVEIFLNDCNGNLIMKSQEGISKEKKFENSYNIAIREAFKTLPLSRYSYEPKGKEDIEVKKETTVKEVTEIEKSSKKTEIIKENLVENDILPASNSQPTYYAQKITLGYQIVDATPKIIMILLSTEDEDVFIVKDKNAIVYKKNGIWTYYENNGDSLKKELLDIKF